MKKVNYVESTRVDDLLISRVRRYLEENVHQTYVDVAVMAKSLQEKYDEYNRQKSLSFRSAVEQAYKIVLHSYGIDDTPPSASENSDDEFNVSNATPSSNHVNVMLTNLYSRSLVNRSFMQVPVNESINILSSDEDESEKQTDNQKNEKQGTQSTQPLISLKEVTVSKVKNSDSNTVNEKRNAASTFGNEQNELNKKRKINNTKNRENDQAKQSSAQSNNKKKKNTDSSQRPKKFKKEVIVEFSLQTFRDVGGIDKILKELCELLFHIKNPEIYHTIGLSPPKGILLHGPPGCGKTLLAHAIAGQLKFGLIEVPATELIAGVSGESEERIREIFEQAILLGPCVLFIDDIDAISTNRMNAQRDMERRVVSQLISCLDSLSRQDVAEKILVIGATTRPEALDPGLRRVGRFDHEIAIGVPDRKEREQILMSVCDVLSLEHPFDYGKIADLTPGYVGADIVALAAKAASIAVKRKYFDKMRNEQKYIPIVDLVEESFVQDSNSKDKAEISEKLQREILENGDLEGNEKLITSESNDKDVKNDLCKENESEKMDVDVENVNIRSESENYLSPNSDEKCIKSTQSNETIDVDEISNQETPKPDSTRFEQLDNEIAKDTTENDEKEKEIKKDGKMNATLLEMIGWLNSGTLKIKSFELESMCITMNDFLEALKVLQPSAKREGFVTIPDVTWNDIGSLRDIREELQLAILAPVKHPEKMKTLGLQAPSGVLLCGPPGCGKTLLAKAIANEAGINFISVKGPELMNMYVGESERAVRTCFQRAKNSAPCVIFFDEFDSLCPKRSNSAEGGSGTRVVNQLLTEMDGIEERKGVFLMAATNRPDIIDPAILRPGRLDTILYVGLPECKDREEILNAVTKNRKQPVLAEDVDLSEIASKTDGYTGADLAGLVRQASLLALKDSLQNPDINIEDLKVNKEHFMKAVKLCRPSISDEDKKIYDKLKLKYAAPRETSN